MKSLKELSAEKYPYLKNDDILEQIAIDRIRFAWEQGVRWGLSKFLSFIPDEDKSAPLGYNTACEDIIDNYEEFCRSL